MAEQSTEKDRKPQQQDDDVVGKAYDSRLMGRLLTYLRPYKLQAVISLVAILLKAGSDVLGPYLTKVAVDRYMTARPAASIRRLDPLAEPQCHGGHHPDRRASTWPRWCSATCSSSCRPT